MSGRFPRRLAFALAALTALLAVAPVASAQTASTEGRRFATIKDDNKLVVFTSARQRTIPITVAGEPTTADFIGIDVRPTGPRAGLLYGITRTGQIYRISTGTGAATLISTTTIAPSGNSFGVDFNPVPDRLRVISDTEQNLRINVDDGATTNDGALAYAAGDPNAGSNPAATGAGYTFAPFSTTPMTPNRPTTLFDIDTAADALTIQNPPNNGTLNTVGDLDRNVGPSVGFDIGGNLNNYDGFALFQRSGSARLFDVDLEDGGTSYAGIVLPGNGYDGLAVLSPQG